MTTLNKATCIALMLLLQNCAVAVPLAGIVGTNVVLNDTVGKTQDYGHKVSTYKCSQLRSEWARLNKDTVSKINPFSQHAAKRSAVKSAAASRKCRL